MANLADKRERHHGRRQPNEDDVAYAQLVMQDAMKKVISTTQLPHAAKTGASVSRRNA